jgi:hypothetical protein
MTSLGHCGAGAWAPSVHSSGRHWRFVPSTWRSRGRAPCQSMPWSCMELLRSAPAVRERVRYHLPHPAFFICPYTMLQRAALAGAHRQRQFRAADGARDVPVPVATQGRASSCSTRRASSRNVTGSVGGCGRFSVWRVSPRETPGVSTTERLPYGCTDRAVKRYGLTRWRA